MSFDVFRQAFVTGEGADGDDGPVVGVLGPLVPARNGNWALIATADGEADVYGLDFPVSGVMSKHASGRAVWSVIFELARLRGMVVTPVGCPTCVVDLAVAVDPPEDVRAPVLVRSGADVLVAVVEAS